MSKKTLAELFSIKPPSVARLPSVDGAFSNQILGMEIEVENCPGDTDLEFYEGLLKDAGWAVKTDGSLRGRAYEFVSTPLREGQLLYAVQSFFARTGFTNDNFTDRCSIHVHANVTDYTVDNLASLALYYQIVEDVLFDFVGNYRNTNIYCIPWNQCRMNYNLITKLFGQNSVQNLYNWQKYTALNILPVTKLGTVEFRHMHGTADIRKISRWVHIISNLMVLGKETPLDETISTLMTLSTTSEYISLFNRIFDGALEYDERYAGYFSDGILNAKYSIASFNFKKRIGVAAKNETVDLTS